MGSRDPWSELLDNEAEALLARARATPGRWRGTYLPNPSRLVQERALASGVLLLGPDTARGGAARTRWMRAFVRACYYQHKESADGTALQFDVGSVRILARSRVGRWVRIRVMPGGRAADNAVQYLPWSRRIYDAAGEPGARWAGPALRDW